MSTIVGSLQSNMTWQRRFELVETAVTWKTSESCQRQPFLGDARNITLSFIGRFLESMFPTCLVMLATYASLRWMVSRKDCLLTFGCLAWMGTLAWCFLNAGTGEWYSNLHSTTSLVYLVLPCARHGVPECFVDMTMIGERHSYPISAPKARYGEKFSLLYDIACRLTKRIELALGIFHSYAHSYACQLKLSPRYLTGFLVLPTVNGWNGCGPTLVDS
ncbi:unnamed protein product [Absidia cylindrospora]